MCTTISFFKKAYIQRWLNREIISATIFDANILLRGPPRLQKTTMACSSEMIRRIPLKVRAVSAKIIY